MSKNRELSGKLCFAMYSATNALVRQYRPLLVDLDLTYPQFVVLMALYEGDNISLRELGERTFFDSGTLTPLVQKLEAKSFLKRNAVPGDERMKKVVLTEKALALKEQITALPDRMRCFVQMNDDEVETLTALARNLLRDLKAG